LTLIGAVATLALVAASFAPAGLVARLRGARGGRRPAA